MHAHQTPQPSDPAPLCANPEVNSQKLIENLEDAPDYPRAIAVADFADIYPYLDNAETESEIGGLDESDKMTLAMSILADHREDFREAMIEAIENKAQSIMASLSPKDMLEILAKAKQDEAREEDSKADILSTPFALSSHVAMLRAVLVSNTGESIHLGDYNSDDPDDQEACRFTIQEKTADGWSDLERCSYCGLLPANADRQTKMRYLQGLVHAIRHDIYENISQICKKYSWKKPDSTQI